MGEVLPPKGVKRTPLLRRLVHAFLLVLIGLMVGFVPMWLKSHECSNMLSSVNRQLSLARIENILASASIDARKAKYEPARQAASNFFTALETESDKATDSVLSQAQKARVKALFAQRDEIITLLARNDPVAADRLSDLYVLYRSIVQP
jgi:hypothetical protein